MWNPDHQQFPATYIQYLFPDLSLVSPRQDLQIWFQSTGMESLGVFESLHRLPKQNVVLNCGVLDPRLLWYVGHLTLTLTLTLCVKQSWWAGFSFSCYSRSLASSRRV